MLNKRIDENWDSYYLVTSFFESQKQKIDYLLTRFPGTLGNLKGTSLFAINLQYLNNVFDYLDVLSIELFKLLDNVSYQEKYKKIRKEIQPSDTVFVDLFHFIDKLQEGSLSNTIILKQISLIKSIKEKTILGSYVNLNNIIKINNLQGLSVYLPFLGKEGSPYYIRIRGEVSKFSQHNWYILTDKIIELFKSSTL